MSSFIKVRAISRSQQVRIGNTKVTRDQWVAIDVDNAVVRRDLERHSAFGAVVAVGPITASPGVAITSGGVVDEGVSATDLAIRVTAGTLRKEDGSTVAIVAGTPSVSAADVTNPRIDNVVVTNTTGVVTIVAGTAAALPVAAAVAVNTTKLAEIAVPANDTAITNSQITDWTPSRYAVAS